MSFQRNSCSGSLKKCATTQCSTSHVLSICVDGTPESIYLWAKQAFLHNVQQRRAFHILAAKFVLHFFSQSQFSDINCEKVYSRYRRCKHLLKLIARTGDISQQVLLLLIALSGSGKQTIVRQFLRYGEVYCSYIKQPFTGTTVLQNVLTGVANPIKASYELFRIIANPSKYDVFNKQSYTDISMSNIQTNSYSQLYLNSLKTMYITKYQTIALQQEDDREYDEILHYTKRKLADKTLYDRESILSSTHLTPQHQLPYQQLQILIVDEITYSTSIHFLNLDRRLERLNNNNYSTFRGTNILVIGNPWQLPAVTSLNGCNSSYS